ncbi:ubiquinone/menaquinone biosynthesis C-methylase UbiE [Phyllobacterium myrsinacearum]|uniref:Ubiquinone/menaquinone biosynthesis C-methylase UbiE n=2 Tax=Phyllobacterium myrsinacearum TaxID=28101 RepID=A0A839F051_9HYPH|nr:ubiquinone/menaquinone biosynthesis C-methylase UbiE [Phyllobacterium myrsinacearum]
MLEHARAKATARQRNIIFRLGDAENTREPDSHYDVITNRHLVWTLVDPQAAFAEWHRILKPGGRVLIVDGDFVNMNFKEQIIAKVSVLFQRLGFASVETARTTSQLLETHRSILSRVHFSDGARASAVAEMLKMTGFENVTIDSDLRRIHHAQFGHLGFWRGMARITQHRYAIVATKERYFEK